jgi:hypothetical protein
MSQIDRLSKKAVAILAQFPGPVTLSQPKWILVVPATVASMGSLYLVSVFWPFLPNLTATSLFLLGVVLAMIWCPVVLMSLLLPVSLKKGLPRLVLDTEGFEIQHVFGVSQKRWADVAGFSPFFLVILLRYSVGDRGFRQKLNRQTVWFAHLGLGAKSLADLMGAWRERALALPTGNMPHQGSSSVSQ